MKNKLISIIKRTLWIMLVFGMVGVAQRLGKDRVENLLNNDVDCETLSKEAYKMNKEELPTMVDDFTTIIKVTSADCHWIHHYEVDLDLLKSNFKVDEDWIKYMEDSTLDFFCNDPSQEIFRKSLTSFNHHYNDLNGDSLLYIHLNMTMCK